ncbi:MAG: ArsR/SmtB family transcription factor [Armatimonadota bacterium]
MTIQEQMQAPLGQQNTLCDTNNAGCLADGFKALADETRLRIMHLLMTRGEMCVCEFMPLLGLTQSNVSFHLKTLKYAGFITSRKEGKWMHYSLNRKALEQFRANFGNVFDFDKWPEKTEPASCESAVCKRMERQ